MFKVGDRVKFNHIVSPDYWDGPGTIKEIDGQDPLDMCWILWDKVNEYKESHSMEYLEDIEHIPESNDILKGLL